MQPNLEQNKFQTQPIQEENETPQETQQEPQEEAAQLKSTEESTSPFTDANKMPESTVTSSTQ
jgi:hypothetical protein